MLPVVILNVKSWLGYEKLAEMKNGHEISCVTHVKGRQMKKNASSASSRDHAKDGFLDPTSTEIARCSHYYRHFQSRVVVVLMVEVVEVATVRYTNHHFEQKIVGEDEVGQEHHPWAIQDLVVVVHCKYHHLGTEIDDDDEVAQEHH